MNRRGWARLGDVLTLADSAEEVELDRTYPMAGVLGQGRGLLIRDPIKGSGTSYRTLRRLSRGQLVYSRLKAFEGAFCLVDERGHGRYVSGEFPSFDLDGDRVESSWLGHLLHTAWFQTRVSALSQGIGARRERLAVEAFLTIEIPLPDLPTQRAIAARLDAVASIVHASEAVPRRTDPLVDSAWLGLEGAPRVRLGTLLDQVVRRTEVDPERLYSLLGVRWYGEGLFVRETKRGSEIKASALYRVQPGDVIYNRLFAWKGSFALAGEVGEAWVSNEFPTFEVDLDRVLPGYLVEWLRRPSVLVLVEEQSTGSTPTSRNRFKVERFLDLEIPLPPVVMQRTVAERLSKVRLAEDKYDRRGALLGSLLPAARNEEFRALLAD